jgi:hypothetical protein
MQIISRPGAPAGGSLQDHGPRLASLLRRKNSRTPVARTYAGKCQPVIHGVQAVRTWIHNRNRRKDLRDQVIRAIHPRNLMVDRPDQDIRGYWICHRVPQLRSKRRRILAQCSGIGTSQEEFGKGPVFEPFPGLTVLSISLYTQDERRAKIGSLPERPCLPPDVASKPKG